MPGTPSATLLSHNVLSWMLQSIVIACAAAPLPIVFRLRHPRMQLYYCHAVLALCLLLPLVQPWRIAGASPALLARVALHSGWLIGILAVGVALQLLWMSNGLWRIRGYRIASTPLYPIPESMRAAAEITQANALFCVSEDTISPVMLGWLAPVVLLPASFLALDEEEQCGIACHELLHVRRGDWLVTVIEGFAGALLWFNPGIWLLLSEARLAREQLVDAESVRLTASREPYIDALLAIARGHVWADLAVAPSFLRRRHLTQRMQMLLSDAPISAARLASSGLSIAVILGCVVWFACATFPMQVAAQIAVPRAQAPSVAFLPKGPTPAAALATHAALDIAPHTAPYTAPYTAARPFIDPYEPVSGGVETASTPEERNAALTLLNSARENGLRHMRGMPPYRFDVSFVASGDVLNTGAGELTETWMTGQKWRWTASLGGVSHAQLLYRGVLTEDRHVAVIPMRAHMLRNEIFWAIGGLVRGARIRTAKVQWQGKAATCVLTSGFAGETTDVQGRGWDEEEYCIDDVSSELVLHSIAPGTYAQFGYDGQTRFHGIALPDRIRIFVAGKPAVDASFAIRDTTAADEESLTPGPEMTSTPQPVRLGVPFQFRTVTSGERIAIVHAEIDGEGNVVETELSASTDAAVVPQALAEVGGMNFGHTGTMRQGYIEVRIAN